MSKYKLTIEIEFTPRGLNSMDHNLWMFRRQIEENCPMAMSKIIKWKLEAEG